MATRTFDGSTLERRRRRLGMSRQVVARRSGVSLSTVNRVLSGDSDSASLGNVRAIAKALGLSLLLDEPSDPVAYLEREAERKARKLVGLVQGTMGLESQGVGDSEAEEMVRRTIYELMAGSRRRLWAD